MIYELGAIELQRTLVLLCSDGHYDSGYVRVRTIKCSKTKGTVMGTLFS